MTLGIRIGASKLTLVTPMTKKKKPFKRKAIKAHKNFLQDSKFKKRIEKPKKGKGSFRRKDRGRTSLE